MHLIIGNHYYGECMQEKDVKRVLASYTKKTTSDKSRLSSLPTFSKEELINEYTAININETKVQIVGDLEEMQKYLYSNSALYEENRNEMLDALNIIGKQLPVKDENIYLIQDNMIVGKDTDLSEINTFIQYYLDKNSENHDGAYFGNYFCLTPNEINQDNCGYTNLFYFKKTDGETSSFSLVYPADTYQKFVELSQAPDSILKNRNSSKHRLISAQLEDRDEIQELKYVTIAEVEPTKTQLSEKQNWEMYHDLYETYQKWTETISLCNQSKAKQKDSKDEFKQITKIIYKMCETPKNEQWILTQYKQDTSTVKQEQLIQKISDLNADDFHKYAVRFLVENVKDMKLAEIYNTRYETYQKFKELSARLSDEVNNIGKDLAEKENEYKKYVPEFSVEELAKKEFEMDRE